MIRLLFGRTYPVISIVFLQAGKWFHQTESTLKTIIFVLQIIIGFLTIYKIYVDIKRKKKKS